MNGIISVSGRNWLLDAIYAKVLVAGVYIGLMTNNVVPEISNQTPFEISELSSISCSGYNRQLCTNWTHISGTSPYIIGSGVTFTISSGSWQNVYGYFVSYNATNSGVLWSELFPPDKGGLIPSGQPIIVTPIYYQS